jgi:CubicO group peptidase (beta-lactamase class C family)
MPAAYMTIARVIPKPKRDHRIVAQPHSMLTLGRLCTIGLVFAHALVGILLVWPAQAQNPDSPTAPRMPSGFAAGANAILAKHYPQDAPGAVAIVVKDGRPVFRRAYGLADLEFGILLEPDMAFRIGSVTKQFTAAAILQLVDAGKLALGDDVSKYVDGYDTSERRVTIEHLLTHTSGIPNYTDMKEWIPHVREELTPRQILDTFRTKPLEFEPGSQFKYSNSGYLLLGLVIEKVSGRPYADYIRQMVLPLGMRQTMYDDPVRVIPRRARGYEWEGDDWRNARYIGMSQPFSAGALVSTVDDLALWNTAIERGRLLSESSRARWFAPFTLASGRTSGYALGWFVTTHDGLALAEHGGGIPGFASRVLRIPSERLYVAVLSNNAASRPGTVARRLAALAIGRPFKDPPLAVVPTPTLEEYAGAYEMTDGEQIRIGTARNRLTVRQHGDPLSLSPSGMTEFFEPDGVLRLTFRPDAVAGGMRVTLWGWGEPREGRRTRRE